jgi:magnesium transporter
MIIAIDGPAASGKGTLGRRIAERYGFAHLDTGLLYRAVARDVRARGGSLESAADALAAARALDVAMDRTEDIILEEGGAPRPVILYGFALRKTLAELRRAVAPMTDLVAEVMRPESRLVGERLAPYYRDVDDHARQATDTIDHARDRINSLLEADLTEQSNQLNDVTRKLAAWAAIIAVPTALTGFFGQNVPYPGYGRWSGFLVSLVLIVASATGLYWYLKHRGWL